jgi:hypothetical protein
MKRVQSLNSFVDIIESGHAIVHVVDSNALRRQKMEKKKKKNCTDESNN